MARDKHLTVAYSDLAKEAEGTADPADQKKMHRIEEASGFGISTVSRLPGNIGLLDMSYFSDDPEAAVALDGAMALCAKVPEGSSNRFNYSWGICPSKPLNAIWVPSSAFTLL